MARARFVIPAFIPHNVHKEPEHTRHILSRFMDAVKSSLVDCHLRYVHFYPMLTDDVATKTGGSQSTLRVSTMIGHHWICYARRANLCP